MLKWQTGKYNGLDSTSITVDKAQELLYSLIYTLSVAVNEDNLPASVLLQGDLQELVRRGQSLLDEKRKLLKEEWELLCLSEPCARNAYYFDTVRNLGLFFKRYDIYYEAHQIPCSIDYPLLCPVSEKAQGISYVKDYIRRLKIENSFLNRFDSKLVDRLLKSHIPNYQDWFLNLCEPILLNAIGLSLLRQDVKALDISKAERDEIIKMLKVLTDEEMSRAIDEAAVSVCRDLGMTDKDAINYFIDASNELYFRIKEAVKHGDLTHIFVALKHSEV